MAAAFVVLAPALAEAQRRGPYRRPAVRTVVVIGGYAYPRYRLYDPWFQSGPYGHPYPPYVYGYGLRDELTASVRLQVRPRDAQVFVDGYLAGTVDDFDGVFQRLRVRPGGHDITLYLEGYRTVREQLYLGPGADRKVELDMAPLAAGEQSEPPPPPSAEEVESPEDALDARPGAQRRPPVEGRELPIRERSTRFGTLSIRVQPADAEILIDGERWSAPAESDRVQIRLSEGRHRVEVRKGGLSTYAEDVLIRRDATLSLNVSLTEP
jgi:hypothetical protein